MGIRRCLNAAELCFPATMVCMATVTIFDVVACAEAEVTGRRHVSELLLPGFKAPTLLLRGASPNRIGMALFVRSGLSVSRQERFKCSCCEFMVAKIPGSTFELLFVCCVSKPKYGWQSV